MQIKMLKDSAGAGNERGTVSITYEKGKNYNMSEGWQKKIADNFINQGWAESIENREKKVVEPTEKKEEKPKKKKKKKLFG